MAVTRHERGLPSSNRIIGPLVRVEHGYNSVSASNPKAVKQYVDEPKSMLAQANARLRLNGDKEVRVKNCLLLKFPRAMFDYWSLNVFIDIDEDAALVLRHFLNSDTYQCQTPRGSTLNEKRLNELAIAIQVYYGARHLMADPLEELAKIEIVTIAENLRVSAVLEAVRSRYTKLKRGKDKWFICYLESRIEAILNNSEELQACGFERTAVEGLRRSDVVSALLDDFLYDLVRVHEEKVAAEEDAERARLAAQEAQWKKDREAALAANQEYVLVYHDLKMDEAAFSGSKEEM